MSDPGYLLVRACVDAGLPVEVLPGPTAAMTALVASGLPVDRFRFAGFLPRRRASSSASSSDAGETLVAFESPRRLAATLALLAEIDPERPVAVCRELTKVHEEVVRGTRGGAGAALRRRHARRGRAGARPGRRGRRGAADLDQARDAVERLVEAGARRRAAAQIGLVAHRTAGEPPLRGRVRLPARMAAADYRQTASTPGRAMASGWDRRAASTCGRRRARSASRWSRRSIPQPGQTILELAARHRRDGVRRRARARRRGPADLDRLLARDDRGRARARAGARPRQRRVPRDGRRAHGPGGRLASTACSAAGATC